MMELLKKHGIPTATATLIVLALTFVPMYFQWKTTAAQNARIAALEQQCSSPQRK